MSQANSQQEEKSFSSVTGMEDYGEEYEEEDNEDIERVARPCSSGSPDQYDLLVNINKTILLMWEKIRDLESANGVVEKRNPRSDNQNKKYYSRKRVTSRHDTTKFSAPSFEHFTNSVDSALWENVLDEYCCKDLKRDLWLWLLCLSLLYDLLLIIV
jgi:hypothetical protein